MNYVDRVRQSDQNWCAHLQAAQGTTTDGRKTCSECGWVEPAPGACHNFVVEDGGKFTVTGVRTDG